MTAQKYKSLRESIGTHVEVARLLGVTVQTLSRRENGKVRITREMEIALKSLVKKGKA